MNELSTQYKTALELNQKIIIAAQMAQQNLYSMCVMLKQMRDDKLYKNLGYQNFEDYCEKAVGFSSRNARNYISIIENISEEKRKTFSAFGTSKLSLLASLSEPEQEEIQEKIDLETTSVRKLKEEIEKLKSEKQEAEKYLSNQAREERQKAEQANDRLTEANKRIKELESRPITVVEDEKMKEENEKLKNLLRDAEQKLAANDTGDYELKNAKATIRELDKQLSIETQDHANEQNRIRRKYQDEINRLNEKLKNVQPVERTVEVVDSKEIFRAYYKNAIGAFNAMLEFTGGLDLADDADFCIKKITEMINALTKKTEALKNEII